MSEIDEADEDRAAVELLLGQELAAPIDEPSDGRRADAAAPDARGVEAPFPGRRVVQAQAQRLDPPGGPSTSSSTRFAAPFQMDRTSEVPRYCAHSGGPAERAHQAGELGRPGSELEVEVVLPVVRGLGVSMTQG